MKKFLTFFLLMAFLNCYSQEKTSLDKAIGTSCFFSGKPTLVVNEFYALIDESNYEKIESELFSKKPENKLLSLLILEELEKLETIKLSIAQREQISNIKKSDEKVLLCSGCTSLKKSSIKDFFKSYNYQIKASLQNRLKN